MLTTIFDPVFEPMQVLLLVVALHQGYSLVKTRLTAEFSLKMPCLAFVKFSSDHPNMPYGFITTCFLYDPKVLIHYTPLWFV